MNETIKIEILRVTQKLGDKNKLCLRAYRALKLFVGKY